MMSDNGIVNQNNDHAPPTALGPVPLRALAPIDGSASDVEGSSDGSYQG